MTKDIISTSYAAHIFDKAKMKTYLSAEVYDSLIATIEDGDAFDETIADDVAMAIKTWALANGATHYTHWFLPLIEGTAEKHDSFIGIDESEVILEFTGKQLIKGEPDASSFPSGGLRQTANARGYTVWDPTSPVFLKESGGRTVLCIPTVFYSYTGWSLDRKAPLIKSLNALDKEAKRVFSLFGHKDVKRVLASVGPEQEYFLIDREKFLKRDDLVFTGRTLFGCPPVKGQELEDHYFGPLKERIAGFIKDLNVALWKLGVSAKTDHNEVAPAQHETAPVFSMCNVASDQNMLVMETMRKIAKRHGLACLLHEKPFAGINGSGKHNNWSIISDTGINMTNPGKNPKDNLLFQLTLACIIKAVDENAVYLRLSASNPGNDFRLGANEAPPAIMSIFLGSELERLIDEIIGEPIKSPVADALLDTKITTSPVISIEATDRNRTSPFAFTGNKFEFRMVASSCCIAECNTALNVVVSQAFKEACDALEGSKDFEAEVKKYIKDTILAHKRVIFNGDGYSSEWIAEAEKRGLPNVKSYVEAIDSLIDPKTISAFEETKVLAKTELEARSEVMYERYSKTVSIEAKTMIEMAEKQIIPACMKYASDLALEGKAVRDLDTLSNITCFTTRVSDTLALIKKANDALANLKLLLDKALKLYGKEQALYFLNAVMPMMNELRKPVDLLEGIVEKKYWPIPTYQELLFEI